MRSASPARAFRSLRSSPKRSMNSAPSFPWVDRFYRQPLGMPQARQIARRKKVWPTCLEKIALTRARRLLCRRSRRTRSARPSKPRAAFSPKKICGASVASGSSRCSSTLSRHDGLRAAAGIPGFYGARDAQHRRRLAYSRRQDEPGGDDSLSGRGEKTRLRGPHPLSRRSGVRRSENRHADFQRICRQTARTGR